MWCRGPTAGGKTTPSDDGSTNPAPMSPHEFKHGLLSLADKDDPCLISETVIARQIASEYIDADDSTQIDLSNMLREDLASVARQQDQK